MHSLLGLSIAMDPVVACLVPLLGVLGGNGVFLKLPWVCVGPLGLCSALGTLGSLVRWAECDWVFVVAAAALAACLARSTLMSMLFPLSGRLNLSPGVKLGGVSPLPMLVPISALLVLVQLAAMLP